jgi:hypothetical protein
LKNQNKNEFTYKVMFFHEIPLALSLSLFQAVPVTGREDP